MRNVLTYSLAATLVAGAAAHQNHHQQHHRRHQGSKVQKRAVVTEVVAATETVYQLNGKEVSKEEAEKGIDGGKYIIVGETEPTYVPPPPPPPSTSTSTSTSTTSQAAATLGAQFKEQKPETTTTPVAPVATSSAYEQPKTQAAAPSSNSGSTYSAGGEGIDSEFPSGEVSCSEFPSKYGAVALDWLDFDGWSGLQQTPDFTFSSLSIFELHTGVKGSKCEKGTMCSYACPPGYQKTQWPKAQGSTKQSIGGLFCNGQGKLELTRPEFKTLCEPGVGGVSIQNDLNEVVATCRTDYPGTENMVIPAIATAGGSVKICNPDQGSYYQWDGLPTTAQYYVNKKGIATKDACVWNSAVDPKGAGNWSPLILGVGRDPKTGITFISLFPNLPTSTAELDFNIEITGDVNSKCAYTVGSGYTGGSNGCTTGLKDGGKAVIRYF